MEKIFFLMGKLTTASVLSLTRTNFGHGSKIFGTMYIRCQSPKYENGF